MSLEIFKILLLKQKQWMVKIKYLLKVKQKRKIMGNLRKGDKI